MKHYLLPVLMSLSGFLSFSQNKVSTKSGDWNDATAWSPSGAPTSTNNVSIAAGHVISINVNASCNALTVGSTGAASLSFSGNSPRSFTVVSGFSISPSSRFFVPGNSNATHSVILSGNLINNGTLDLSADNNSRAVLLFNGAASQTLGGSGSLTNIYRVVLNKGTSAANILDITSTDFTAPVNFLTLSNGTFKLSTPNACTVVPFTNATSIPSTAGIWLNSASSVMSFSATTTLSGLLRISAGNLDIGNANNEDLTATGGTLIISGGSLDIAGKYNASSAATSFSMSGGTLLVPSFASSNTGVAPFNFSAPGSVFNMSGGTILLRREGGGGSQDLGYVNTGATSGAVTGGTLQLGMTGTPASQTICINSTFRVPNLIVASSSVTAKVLTNSLSVTNNISIQSGTLNANSLNISLGGNWSNTGSFVPGTQTVTFSSGAAQSISRAGGETFSGLVFSGSGIKTFSSAVTAAGNFSVAPGSTVDVSPSGHALSVRGNLTVNGMLLTRGGLVTLNGTTSQTLGGTSTFTFNNLTINNTAGVTLTGSVNLLGTLSLNNGSFNLNGKPLTMISNATNNARIGQITGSGALTGSVTAQRYIPGGATGWALLGTYITSPLTLKDWDDDIYITCPTCPDGSMNFLSVYTYSEQATGAYDSGSSYVPLSTINDPVQPGKGYWVYMGNGQFTTTSITMDVTGTVRQGNYTLPIFYTNTGVSSNDGWNLVHNPYPSAISWNALRGSTSNLDNAVYVYNADLNAGTGAFASYVNGISSPAVGNGGIGDNIPMWQGFYVHSTGATGLNCTESIKTNSNPVFLKSTPGTLPLRFFLRGASYRDETVVYFQQGASDTFDVNFDAYKVRGFDPYSPSIAQLKISDGFQVNAIAPLDGSYTTPLLVTTGYSGTYTISTESLETLPPTACVRLYDRHTQLTTDLRGSNYVFFLSDTTSAPRFDLTITMKTLGLNATVEQPTCEKPEAGNIKVKGANSGPWSYTWKKNGALVHSALDTTGALINAAPGIYQLEINTPGQCDFASASYTINHVRPSKALFVSPDSVYLSPNAIVEFTNQSVNSSYNDWDFGNQSSSPLLSPSSTYHTPGTYTVTLIVKSETNCIDTFSRPLVVLSRNEVSSVALAEHGKEHNWIVKTLGDNNYSVRYSPETGTRTFSLVALSGQVVRVYRVEGTSGELDLNLNDLEKGIYILDAGDGKRALKLAAR